MENYINIRLVYIASALSLSILVIFGLLYMEKSREQVQYIDAVEHTYKVLSAIDFCEKTLISAEAIQRGFLLTSESNYKEGFEATLPAIDSSLKVIGAFTADNPNQTAFFYQLTKFVNARVGTLNRNLLFKVTDPLYYENLRAGVAVMDNCRLYMAKMRGVEENLLQDRLEKKDKFQRLNLYFFKATFITFCLICIIAIGIFFREFGIRLKAQKNLKDKVAELSKRKRELEEITFAASHDLQEPMRKIRILSNLVVKKFSSKVSPDDLDVIHRINTIAEQMHGQLNDLVLYTNLLNPPENYSDINLYEIFKTVYDKIFKNENVQFQISANFPLIKGSRFQLETMLGHIMENAFKFKAPGRDLSITVVYELKQVKDSTHFWENVPAKHFHQVTISDNGIGFDNQYNDKIFGLFQRLHTQTEYPGKGIGLAISRRVMSNHNGYILSVGEKTVGASFILQFPVISGNPYYGQS